jgi:regulator of protease activity HflC (stomatin/prohibitin superfamily)
MGRVSLVAAGAVVVLLLVAVLSASGCYSTPQAGEVGVVRNGGPFDNHNIRQVVPNGSGNTWIGFFSDAHYYPVDTQQRFFKMESCGAGARCQGADAPAVTVPTSDGVEVQVEGTFYLNTVFDNTPEGAAALKAFDTQFATRTFEGRHAYEGPEGWSAFLGAIVEPIVANNLRETISGVTCAELVSSCALVQNSQRVNADDLAKKNNQSNISRIQQAVETGLDRDLVETLGGSEGRRYFKNIRFNLKVVNLPAKVQAAINDAQSAFAEVSQSQAKKQQARIDSDTNRIKQQGYRRCPTCARIDAIKALPPGLTALGGDLAVGVR